MLEEKVKKIYTGYLPRDWQDLAHRKVKRFNVFLLHRRAGKSVFCVNEILDQALRCEKRNPQYAYLSPTFSASKRIAWQILKDAVAKIPTAVTNEQDLKCIIDRPDRGDKITIWLLGAENPNAIRGIYLDGCVLDEMAQINPSVWTQVIRPTLSDRQGWAIFISTPNGYNFFKTLWDFAGDKEKNKDIDNWFRFSLKASESGILPDSELEAARATMSEENYSQEYELDWGATMTGAYYAKQIKKAVAEKRITRVPYDAAAPVSTYWDIGISDSTVIWFLQIVGREYHIIKYIESSGVGLDWYAKKIMELPYVYEEHVLPHDAAARELGTGKSREEILREYGMGRIRILPRAEVADGINAVRMLLDKCWFDEVECARGLDCLTAYQKAWNEKTQMFSDTPLHNWASHGADGFRTLAMGVRPPERRRGRSELPQYADTRYDIFNYGDE